ncbi:MAG: exopolyphosphatase [Robiginitomaculum sp.]|nr:MAG: exopolyphosphatase [Robiginitomaculum sp.]
MTDGEKPSSRRHGNNKSRQRSGRQSSSGKKLYAALDLGTNNCRLLIATPTGGQFRVVDGFSRIVRLGEGLDESGKLSDPAMERAFEALKVCAHKLAKTKVKRVRAVATQACRTAINGSDFIERVRQDIGLSLKIISTEEEARLALRGCMDLFDHECEAALVIDIGGGSTEISWVQLAGIPDVQTQKRPPYARLQSWVSLDLGVVTMAERFPEREDREQWFEDMCNHAREKIAKFEGANEFRSIFAEGRTHHVGTSGAVTSLGGLHLNLARYQRAKVDGLWLSDTDTVNATQRLLSKNLEERAAEPCIGGERADLVLAGCAILQAIQLEWPSSRIRVADRGLREGLLLSMMAFDRKKRGPRGRRR